MDSFITNKPQKKIPEIVLSEYENSLLAKRQDL